VVVTVETPPDSARTQLTATEKRHVITVNGKERSPEESSLPAVYTGDLESASRHKFMSDLLDVYERHYDSGEIKFRDLRSRKDYPVVVTLETPPDSARTQLTAMEKRHVITVNGKERSPEESSLPAVDRQSSGAPTQTYMKCEASIDRGNLSRHLEESDL